MSMLDDLASDLNPKKIVKDSVEGALNAGAGVAKVGLKAAIAVHEATRQGGGSVTGLHIRDRLSGNHRSSSSGGSITGLHLRSRLFG